MAENQNLGQWRDRVSLACLIGVFVLGLLAGPLLYVSNVVAEEDAFVALTNDIIVQPDVRRYVADEAATIAFEAAEADELIAQILPEEARAFSVPLTSIATQQATNAAFGILETEAGSTATDAALRQLHNEFNSGGDTLVVDLRAVLVRTAREIGGPTIGAAVAQVVSGSEQGRFVLVEPDTTAGQLLAVVRALPTIGGLAAIALIVLVIATVASARDWRRALTRVGLVMATSALLSVVAVSTILAAVLSSAGDVGLAVADLLGVDFATQQRGFMLTGAVLALIGLVLGPRPAAVALRRLPADLWRRDEQLPVTVSRIIGDNPPLARLVVFSISIAVLLSWPNPTLRVVITAIVLTLLSQLTVFLFTDPGDRAAGWRRSIEVPEPTATAAEATAGNRHARVNLAVLAVVVTLLWPAFSTQVLLRLFVAAAVAQVLVDALPARRLAVSARTETEADLAVVVDAEPMPRRWLIPAAVAALVTVVGGAALILGSTETSAAATGCNGYEELCDRRIDEVVFAGSHNAMSSNDLGWELAMQDGDMVAQLDHGVRALLIDALYWDATGTVEGGDDPGAAAVIEAALSDDVPQPGTWLCHGFCALGATDLIAGLTSISAWLDGHPRQVLLIVVQDEIDPEDLETAFERSGLLDRVHVRGGDDPWPTLGQLIEVDERILVYAENGGEPGTWIQNGYAETFTETPFNFALRSEFSCDPNRGDADNPLFLVNHWLTTGIPVREAAAAVNSRGALLDRVEQCEAERGVPPTVLAVDFVETGDLIDVVAELNGVG